MTGDSLLDQVRAAARRQASALQARRDTLDKPDARGHDAHRAAGCRALQSLADAIARLRQQLEPEPAPDRRESTRQS